MHRVIAGCNLWALLFLGVAFVLGLLHSPWHQNIGIFAAVFALLAQSAIFALFMGAYWLLQEHVQLYRLGDQHVAATRAVMLPLFAWASVTSGLLLVTAILGGLGASGEVPAVVHAVFGALDIVVLAFALSREVPAMARMHEILAAMERSLPVKADRAPGEPLSPPPPQEGPDLRSRALFYIGSTVLAMLFGYRFISGITISGSLAALIIGVAGICLVASAVLRFRPAR